MLEFGCPMLSAEQKLKFFDKNKHENCIVNKHELPPMLVSHMFRGLLPGSCVMDISASTYTAAIALTKMYIRTISYRSVTHSFVTSITFA
jgi:hypothetical protein